jgi:hypothetical protein
LSIGPSNTAVFVDEDVPARIPERLRFAPLAPALRDIRATLFVGVCGF